MDVFLDLAVSLEPVSLKSYLLDNLALEIAWKKQEDFSLKKQGCVRVGNPEKGFPSYRLFACPHNTAHLPALLENRGFPTNLWSKVETYTTLIF